MGWFKVFCSLSALQQILPLSMLSLHCRVILVFQLEEPSVPCACHMTRLHKSTLLYYTCHMTRLHKSKLDNDHCGLWGRPLQMHDMKTVKYGNTRIEDWMEQSRTYGRVQQSIGYIQGRVKEWIVFYTNAQRRIKKSIEVQRRQLGRKQSR